MVKNSFEFYGSWLDAIENFPVDIQLEIYKGIAHYGLGREMPELSETAEIAMKFIAAQINLDRERYEAKCAKMKDNISKRYANTAKVEKSTKATNATIVEESTNATIEYNCSKEKEKKKENEKEKKKSNIKEIENKEKEINKEKESLPALTNVKASSVDTDPAVEDGINYKAFLEFYNKYASKSNLVRCERLTEKRRQAIRARIKEFGKEKVALAIRTASTSKFLNGHNDRNWRANFDFILNANKLTNILEGKYDDKNGNGYTQDYSPVQNRAKQERLDDAAERVKRLLANSDKYIQERAQQTDDGV